MMSRLSWMKSFIGGYRKTVFVSLVLGLATAAGAALLMFSAGYLMSATAQAGITLFAIMIPVAFVQLFGLGKPLARYFERLVSHAWVLRLTSTLRRMLYRHISKAACDASQGKASGEYLSTLSDDIDHLQNLYLRVIFPSAVTLALSLLTLLFFGCFSWPAAGVLALVFFNVAIALPVASFCSSNARNEKIKDLRKRETTQLTDHYLGVEDWILSGRAEEIIEQHGECDSAIRKEQLRIRQFDRIACLLASLVLGATICAIIAWSSSAFGESRSTTNWIAAFALGFFPLIESFLFLPPAASYATAQIASVDSISKIAGVNDVTLAQRTGLSSYEGFDIEISDMAYAYPSAQTPTVSHLDLFIPSGQSVAVIGKSGSGKSTLVNLIRGMLQPTEGSIAIGEQPIEAQKTDTSNIIGYLSQSPYLFNKTLRENLRLSNPEAPDALLEEAIDMVKLRDRIDMLPEGLNTVIGETGEGFSCGEAHRIALARIIVAQPEILIADEPFSALDPATETDLLNSIVNYCKGRTLVVVTHHLGSIDLFDRVVFLEDGKVALDGSPAELARTSERFRMLVEFDQNI